MLNKYSSREKKLLPYISLFFLLLLILWIAFAPSRGMLALHRSQEEIARLQAENDRLVAENKTLQEEMQRLRDDPAYLEEKARKEFGMLKENELLYIFKEKK